MVLVASTQVYPVEWVIPQSHHTVNLYALLVSIGVSIQFATSTTTLELLMCSHYTVSGLIMQLLRPLGLLQLFAWQQGQPPLVCGQLFLHR